MGSIKRLHRKKKYSTLARKSFSKDHTFDRKKSIKAVLKASRRSLSVSPKWESDAIPKAVQIYDLQPLRGKPSVHKRRAKLWQRHTLLIREAFPFGDAKGTTEGFPLRGRKSTICNPFGCKRRPLREIPEAAQHRNNFTTIVQYTATTLTYVFLKNKHCETKYSNYLVIILSSCLFHFVVINSFMDKKQSWW